MLLGGCSASSTGLLNSWLDPTAVGGFNREGTREIRTALSIQDSSWGVPGATEPTPADLEFHPQPYRFAAGDAMNIRIFELLARETEAMVQATVDDMGDIRLPVVGTVSAGGLSARELEEELVDQLAQKELIKDAQVVVEPLVRRNATYIVFGATAGANIYPLPKPDFRLLEALSVAGGLDESVLDIYVFRQEVMPTDDMAGPVPPVEIEGNEPAEEYTIRPVSLSAGYPNGVQEGGGWYVAGSPPEAEPEVEAEPAATSPPPNAEPVAESQPASPEPIAETQPASEEPPSYDDAVRELIDSVVSTPPADEAEETGEPADLETDPSSTSFVFLNGKWIEVKRTTSAPTTRAAEQARPMQQPLPFPEPAEPVIDWSALAGEKTHRIIHVAADALRNGDPRQNLVVRAGDVIRLRAGEVGEYYLMGQVNRPGAYSITARQMTLKAAIASAGNLAVLAWPERCTVYRRLGDREEMIQVNLNRLFAGDDPDFFIKKNDLIVVGTHPAAVFLAVLRNAFRMTYGFGFVWDRNFADTDSTIRTIKAQARASREIQASNALQGLFQ